MLRAELRAPAQVLELPEAEPETPGAPETVLVEGSAPSLEQESARESGSEVQEPALAPQQGLPPPSRKQESAQVPAQSGLPSEDVLS